jgi:hypothetical protein
MLARVLDRRDDARIGVGTTALSAFALLGVLADDLSHVHLFPSGKAAYAAVALLMALAGLAPWIARGRKGKLVNVACGSGLVALGKLTIAANEVQSVHVARAAQGASVAIALASGGTIFVAVERPEDAILIARALGREGELPIARGAPLLAGLQGVFTLGSLAFALLYWSGATGALPFGEKEDGVLGVVFALLSLALVLTRRRAALLGHRLALRSKEWDAHVSLHAQGEEEEEKAPASGHVPSALARGDESMTEWLARLDALAASSGAAYREGALDRESLFALLEDPATAPDVRIAAARLLEKRFGAKKEDLVRVAADPDVRLRVEAVLDDEEEEDEAPERLARLGPLFRAR